MARDLSEPASGQIGRAELDIEGLTVSFGTGEYTVTPIEDLTIAVRAGSMVLLLGPSGCGKTTLLSCLGGILTPTTGTIRVGEVEVTALRGAELTRFRREQVGIVFQAFNLIPSLTALENVCVPLRAAGTPKKTAVRRATGLLERVGLGHRLDHRPGDLSGGQQQRVAVARALALDPPLILADEPTAHLDFIQVESTIRLLRDLADEGRTVVVSTHDSRLIPLADHVIELAAHTDVIEVEPRTVELAAGAMLFRQGEKSDLVFMVDAGTVDILREHPDGSEELLTTLEPGTYFGEMGPMLGIPRTATARAHTDATLTGYTLRQFRAKMNISERQA